MRKLIAGACILALAATASPALANGQGRGGGQGQQNSVPFRSFDSAFDRGMKAFWSQRFGPSGFGAFGKHFGWFRGKHWGWFKPHHPHWPHHPTSP